MPSLLFTPVLLIDAKVGRLRPASASTVPSHPTLTHEEMRDKSSHQGSAATQVRAMEGSTPDQADSLSRKGWAVESRDAWQHSEANDQDRDVAAVVAAAAADGLRAQVAQLKVLAALVL